MKSASSERSFINELSSNADHIIFDLDAQREQKEREKRQANDSRYGTLVYTLYPDGQLQAMIPFETQRDKKGTAKNKTDDQIDREIKRTIREEKNKNDHNCGKKERGLLGKIGKVAGYGIIGKGSKLDHKKSNHIRRVAAAVDLEYRKNPVCEKKTFKVKRLITEFKRIEYKRDFRLEKTTDITWSKDEVIDIKETKQVKEIKLDQPLIENIPMGKKWYDDTDYTDFWVNYDNSNMRFLTLTVPCSTDKGLFMATAWCSYLNKLMTDSIRNIANKSLPVTTKVQLHDNSKHIIKISYDKFLAVKKEYKQVKKAVLKGENKSIEYPKITVDINNDLYEITIDDMAISTFKTGYDRIAMIKVQEYQKRGALHWHYVIGCDDQVFLKELDKQHKNIWISALKNVDYMQYILENKGDRQLSKGQFNELLKDAKKRCTHYLFERKQPLEYNGQSITNYLNYPDLIKTECVAPNKSVAAYLSKYLSKGGDDKKGFGCKEKIEITDSKGEKIEIAPSRWFTMNKLALKLNKKHTKTFITPVKMTVKELKYFGAKVVNVFKNNGIINSVPCNLVKAKYNSNELKKGEKYVVCKDNESVTKYQVQRYDANFTNYFASMFLKDNQHPDVQVWLKQHGCNNILDFIEQFFIARIGNKKNQARVQPWLKQQGYKDINEFKKQVEINKQKLTGKNIISEIIQDAVINLKGQNFTPDEVVDYVNNCLKNTTVSTYQVAPYFQYG